MRYRASQGDQEYSIRPRMGGQNRWVSGCVGELALMKVVSDFNKKTVTIEPALQPIQEHIKGPVDHRPSDVKDIQPDARFLYSLPYDKLVIAVGCYSASFGIPGVRGLCAGKYPY